MGKAVTSWPGAVMSTSLFGAAGIHHRCGFPHSPSSQLLFGDERRMGMRCLGIRLEGGGLESKCRDVEAAECSPE